MANFKKTFKEVFTKELQEKLNIKNVMAVPRITKIVINMSLKEFLQDKKNLEKAKEDLGVISGQKPKVTRARLSIATFKLREGEEIGLMTTLRGKRMYDFLEKLVKMVFPRVKDFSGVDLKANDGRGNITIGFSEHTVFSEIDPGKVDKIRSLQVTLVTNCKKSEDLKILLETLGFKFKKDIF